MENEVFIRMRNTLLDNMVHELPYHIIEKKIKIFNEWMKNQAQSYEEIYDYIPHTYSTSSGQPTEIEIMCIYFEYGRATERRIYSFKRRQSDGEWYIEATMKEPYSEDGYYERMC